MKKEKDTLLSNSYLKKVDAYWRAANYLSVAQLYLMDNPLLFEPLKPTDIKKKIVGHWGTCPGQNFVYTHLNRIIKKNNLDMLLISGPGHGGNFFVANSYIEGYYSEVYPKIPKLNSEVKTPDGVGTVQYTNALKQIASVKIVGKDDSVSIKDYTFDQISKAPVVERQEIAEQKEQKIKVNIKPISKEDGKASANSTLDSNNNKNKNFNKKNK